MAKEIKKNGAGGLCSSMSMIVYCRVVALNDR